MKLLTAAMSDPRDPRRDDRFNRHLAQRDSLLSRAPTMIQEIGFAQDSPLEGAGFELVWGFSCQVVIFGL
jgi:hypothetical protein